MITQVPFRDAEEIWHHACHENGIPGPFVCYDWHKLWYRVFEMHADEYILTYNNQVIAPFVKTKHTIRFSGGEEIADYLDILGGYEQKKHAWEEIIAYVKKEGVTRLHLRNIPESSATLEYFSKIPNAVVQKEDTTPRVILPSSWEKYLASLTRKYRHELERKLRKFEREHPNGTYQESDHPSSDMETFLSLMEKNPAKRNFLTTQMKIFFLEMAKEFKDQISLLLLTVDGIPSAGTLSFIHNKTYYLYNSGFDRSCCQNAGFYLKAQSIKMAIERGFDEYNFLQGSERYKYELGGKDFGVYTVVYTIT